MVAYRGGALTWSALWLALMLAGCAAAPEPPIEPAAPPAELAALPPAPTAAAPQEPELCTVLAALVARETEGFESLRARPISDRAWVARTVPPGTERCTIEGEVWPSARYRCTGPLLAAGRAAAEADYAALVEEIDRCLARPIWFPRDWQRGEPFEFAMGERLQAWTDRSTSPPSQIVLRVQRDLASRAYRVKLDLEAVP